MRPSYLLRLSRHARRLSAVLHQCQGRDLFHKAKRWTEDTRLLQKLAITATHPFGRIRSFEDCLADEEVHCELLSEAAVYALGRFIEER
jgi:hypothetical protein